MQIEIKFDLKRALKERGMTANELSKRTGIRASTLSEMQRRQSLNLPHVATIMAELGITDIKDIITVEKIESKKVSSL